MDEDYTDYLFHAQGAMKGTVIGIIVAILSGVIILLAIINIHAKLSVLQRV